MTLYHVNRKMKTSRSWLALGVKLIKIKRAKLTPVWTLTSMMSSRGKSVGVIFCREIFIRGKICVQFEKSPIGEISGQNFDLKEFEVYIFPYFTPLKYTLFYKNILYKNIHDEFSRKVKNVLRILPS